MTVHKINELVNAVSYCRLGSQRPASDAAFHEAKAIGLLAQDPVWRATARGEGALVAAGLMPGEPAPSQITLAMHWGVCPRWPTPQLVRVWTEWAWEHVDPTEIEDAEMDFRGYGDPEPWRFFTTIEQVDQPKVPAEERDETEAAS